MNFDNFKKKNHFKYILSELQGKETIRISDDEINKIIMLIRNKALDLNNILNNEIINILESLNYKHYFSNVRLIKRKLGVKIPSLTHTEEQKLCEMFSVIEQKYSIQQLPISFHFIIYKLCELLNITQVSMFPTRKCIEYNKIWKEEFEILFANQVDNL
jgi:hypothetical protein